MTLGRREFIGSAAVAAATAAKLAGAAVQPRRFSLNYAPHFGMFRHSAGTTTPQLYGLEFTYKLGNY